MSDEIFLDALKRAQSFSPFLAKLIIRNEELLPYLKSGDIEGAWSRALTIECASLSETLRLQRGAVALISAIADLSTYWDLTQVTHHLSDFADHVLNRAIEAAFAEYLPEQEVRGFAVIALGKHGGYELNYSSDIDPIFIFDPETLPCDESQDASKIAIRIGKRVIALLNERTEHDYVLRVDMRLRPASEITPVAISVNAAISHYESSALAWEQAAFIRARASAGDIKLGQYFLDSIDTFIWRRSLDFGQIENIRKMSYNIRDHYSNGQVFGAGYDLKRGRGGIRECEFFTQVHQLIHGGRNASLRLSDTRSALKSLVEYGHIKQEDAQILSDGYILLRTIEHRLQMVNDRQIHALPNDMEAIENIAKLHGLENSDQLLEIIKEHVEKISALYNELVQEGYEEDNIGLAEEGVPLFEQLQSMGHDDCEYVIPLIQRWRSGKYRAIRSDAAKASFELIVPQILHVLAQAPDPQRSLSRLDNILEQLPSAINFFNLLHSRPAMLKLLADILSYAPTLADALARNAALFDGLIGHGKSDVINKDSLRLEMKSYFTDGLDYQSLLDAVRNFVAEKRFVLGVRLIEGRIDSQQAAHGYAMIAEAAIDVLTKATISEFEVTHGNIVGSELLILALGRFGGKSLTHASDLDIIFLFTGDFLAESNGRRSLGGTQYFNRLAQRVIAALSVPTASGALYEIDTRLRPSGKQGLLCVSVDSFGKYQRENAWTWEHMALTRARLIFGSEEANGKLESIITNVIGRQRGNVYKDIVAMRHDMDRHKPAKAVLDIKNCRGGLIDIEFIVHALQLQHGIETDPDIEKSIMILISDNLLPKHIADAYHMMSNMLILLRLICPDLNNISDAAKQLMADNLGYAEWSMVMNSLSAYQQDVIQQWENIFSEKRLIEE